jgi:hypothetical protein
VLNARRPRGGQGGAACAKTEQGNADDHEGKIMELRHRKKRREIDLEGQHEGGEQTKTVTGSGVQSLTMEN